LPKVLQAIESPPGNKWKVKVVALELLNDSLLVACHEKIPKQLENYHLVRIVKILCACCKEVRAEIKDTATKLMKSVGGMVRCAEIRSVADKIVSCLVNFGNMKQATETLYLIANTTFLSYVDAASFALIFPIVERAMKERQQDSRKNGIMITGACVTLIEDPTVLTKYLDALLPLLEDLAVDPSFEIQRESAKAFGALAKNIPELLENRMLPWALDKLQSNNGDIHNSETERQGSAYALADMMDQAKGLAPRVLIDHMAGRLFDKKSPHARAGGFILIEALSKTSVCEPFVNTCFSWVMKGLQDDHKLVSENAMKAGRALVNEFSGSQTTALIKALCDAILSFDGSASEDESPRSRAISLFRLLIEKVSELKKYGQDMLTMDCCTLDTRQTMCCMLQLSRCDADPGVRRQSNKLWNEGVQSSTKAKKDTRDVLLCSLRQILLNSKNANKLQSVETCLKSMRENKEGELTSEELIADASIDIKKSVFVEFDWERVDGSEEYVQSLPFKAGSHGKKNADSADSVEEKSTEIFWTDLESRAMEVVTKKSATSVTSNALSLEAVLSAMLENRDASSALACLKQINSVLAETALVQEIITESFVGFVSKDVVVDKPEEVLCRIDNLMLMYGGGTMLLKDTMFELRKGKRYGVVGRNGAGKTTLMNLLAKGQEGIAQLPADMTAIHVKPEVLDYFMMTKCKDFMKLENPTKEMQELEETLRKVQFPENLWNVTIGELSGGWRMRLLIAGAMMKKADVLLLDEPTNHLDTAAVQWLCDYLNGLQDSAIMVISHDPTFLNRVCTNIINYNSGKLVYYDGNFDAFTAKLNINADDVEALLAGHVGVGENGIEREDPNKKRDEPEQNAEGNADDASTATGDLTPRTETSAEDDNSATSSSVATNSKALETQSSTATNEAAPAEEAPAEEEAAGKPAPDKKAKIVFPIPGKVKGVNSLAKPVLEVANLTWAYNEEKGDVLQGVSAKLTMNSRVHIKGVNGAGKSTFINLICGEVHPSASACPQKGTVNRHRNCRLAYMAQQHMHHMMPFMNSSPYVYIQKRFAAGCDGALQERLMASINEEQVQRRKDLAKQHGKYGNEVENLVGRQMRGKEPYYEVRWKNSTDSKQNTWEPISKLRDMDVENFALAYDERASAAEAGLDQRPLSQREICKHLEQFGITEELALNRTIGMFSAGQKSKVSLAAAFWCKPHIIALDEPTNYIDMETLDALTVALQRFKGGVVCISHCGEFASKVCNETWFLENGGMTVTKVKAEKPEKKEKA